ncbi:hypothetical protein BHM03_00059522, partial [Ensete ventricosum]
PSVTPPNHQCFLRSINHRPLSLLCIHRALATRRKPTTIAMVASTAKLAMLTLAAVACTYAAKHLFPDQSPFLLSLPLLLFFLTFVFSRSDSNGAPPGPVSFPIFGN